MEAAVALPLLDAVAVEVVAIALLAAVGVVDGERLVIDIGTGGAALAIFVGVARDMPLAVIRVMLFEA